jgi:MFS family permease
VASLTIVLVAILVGGLLSSEISDVWGDPPANNALFAAVVFVAFVSIGAFLAGLAAERSDPWFAIAQSVVVVGLAAIGFAMSAVESGEVAVAENLVIAIGGVSAAWLGYLAAQAFHRKVK